MEMNLDDIKKYYSLLQHEQETEIRCIKKDVNGNNLVVGPFFCSNFNDFLSCCIKFNGLYNLYSGLQERENKGTSSKDVKAIRIIFFDIDAGKDHKDKAATQFEIAKAVLVTDSIVKFLEEKTQGRPTIISSGNGFQLLYKIPTIYLNDDNREEIQERIKIFTEGIISKFSTPDVKIDNVSDLPRISRIPGTLNLKGGKISKIIEFNDNPNHVLKDYILNFILPQKDRVLVSSSPISQARYYNIVQMENRCLFLKNNIDRVDLGHFERVGMMFLYLRLGPIGEKRLIEILSRQNNYNAQKTSRFIENYKKKENFLGVSCRKLISWNACHYSECPCYGREKGKINLLYFTKDEK